MIVVADTSVILNLCQVGLDHLLKELFDEVFAPQEVADEFQRIIITYPLFGGAIFPEWIKVQKASQSLQTRSRFWLSARAREKLLLLADEA